MYATVFFVIFFFLCLNNNRYHHKWPTTCSKIICFHLSIFSFQYFFLYFAINFETFNTAAYIRIYMFSIIYHQHSLHVCYYFVIYFLVYHLFNILCLQKFHSQTHLHSHSHSFSFSFFPL